MILRPQENFTVVRVLTDHTDSGTYYVKAVIRNSRTGDTITSLNLTDQGSRRFTRNWQVPEFNGDMMFVDITTTVYTDSGYTTKSSNYGEEVKTIQIERRRAGHTGGGAASVDYKKVKQIVKDCIAEIQMPEIPEQIKPENFDYDRIANEVSAAVIVMREAVSMIPAQVESILAKTVSPELQKAASELLSAVNGIDIPEPEKLDLTPVLEAYENSGLTTSGEHLEKTSAAFERMVQELPQLFEQVKKIQEHVQQFNHVMMMPYGGMNTQPKQEKQPKQSISRARRLMTGV